MPADLGAHASQRLAGFAAVLGFFPQMVLKPHVGADAHQSGHGYHSPPKVTSQHSGERYRYAWNA